MRVTRRAERGSATMPLVGVMIVASVVVAGMGRLGEAVVARARVDAVGDLVALAGATGGQDGATEVATSNGAAVVSFGTRGNTTVVTVQRNGTTTVAAARVVAR